MNSKTTKRALLGSVLAMLLCFTMLLSTTFAWFTDTVTSANNVIKSGTLDVAMYYADGTKAVPADDSTDWNDASTGAIFNYDKWEPGYVEVRHIKIANVGTLALKYKVEIVANGTVSDLADVIDVYYVDPAVQVAGRDALVDSYKLGTLTEVLEGLATTGNGTLIAGDDDTITLALKMQETAGNEYQGKEIGSTFSVVLLATQLNSEKDSFDTDYDKNAVVADYYVTDANELIGTLANATSGEVIAMMNDVETEAKTTAPYGNKYAVKLDGAVLDGNGNELYMECYGDDYGIMTSGGTVKNITIKEGCRAVMIMYPTQDIVLDNVNIGGDGVLYPINTGEAGATGVKLIVTNSTLAGWTSFSNIESASFTNVKFEQGTYYNDIYGRVLKPFVNTTLTDCSFIEHMNLDLSGLTQGHKVTIKNCTVNGQAVTASVFTVPSSDADYDTELFTVDLPSWASSVNDCIIFE